MHLGFCGLAFDCVAASAMHCQFPSVTTFLLSNPKHLSNFGDPNCEWASQFAEIHDLGTEKPLQTVAANFSLLELTKLPDYCRQNFEQAEYGSHLSALSPKDAAYLQCCRVLQ